MLFITSADVSRSTRGHCAIVYSLVAVGPKYVMRARPAVARRVNQFSGLAMIVIALLLFVEQFARLMR
jgi:hypothetical protein